ncbi:MAG: OmpA family protein, partial [Prevotella sp.]|nr:OmpA family protein [Prevotella sp.]
PAAAAVVETVEPLRRDIFFPINVTAIQPSEAQKVKDIADYLQKYPNAKVVVTGYADAGTGNDRINDRLAAGRADTVVKALMNQYGIAQSRISYDSKGSRVQPFAENDMNRVSICIAE